MKLRALGDWILIKLIPEEIKTSSGLYIPEKSQPVPWKAEVVSVGESVQGIELGQKVIFKKWNGYDHKEGNDKFKFVHLEDLSAIIEE